MYSMNDTLNSKTNMSNPKKDNMFHNVRNVLNVLWERFSRVSLPFVTYNNYPLSVTVVHNEGIIPPDFYKNVTTKKELLNNDNVYICNSQIKESLNIIESIHRDVHDEKKSYIDRIFNENIKDSIGFNYKCIDNENRDLKKCDEKESFMKENVVNNTTKSNFLLPFQSDMGGKDESFKYIYSDTNIHKTYDKAIDYNCERIHDSSIDNNEQFSDYVTIDTDNIFTNVDTTFSTSRSIIEKPQSIPQTTKSNLLNMWQNFVCSVTDRFCRTDSNESDLLMKRSCSPKQRRKLNTIAKGRGRGRAKSQLRRSGVSQTRHRKERTKHDLKLTIQNDLKSWEEFETYDTNQNESENCFNYDEDTVDGLDSMQYIMKEAIIPATFTFADIQPKKTQKSKAHKNVDQRMCKFSTKMRFIPECTIKANTFDQDIIDNGYNYRKNTFRPRLISESSIDSEDSYCIVFETGSGEIHDSDFEDFEDSNSDQISEDEDTCTDNEFLFPTQKVKFNLNPVVHIMVQWDYAYRAARKGPWEEMARDRERFKGRINCIEHVLNPVLTVQHRTHIWQERFACIE